MTMLIPNYILPTKTEIIVNNRFRLNTDDGSGCLKCDSYERYLSARSMRYSYAMISQRVKENLWNEFIDDVEMIKK